MTLVADALQWVFEHPTPPLLAAFAFASWFIKQQLERQWSRDLEATKSQLSKDLEAAKAMMQREHAVLLAQHQRELEAYKVSLIAEAERARATQDVAKALALKVSEKRFEALSTMHDSAAGLAASACAFAKCSFPDADSWARSYAATSKEISTFTTATTKAAPFLTLDARGKALSLSGLALELVMMRDDLRSPTLTEEDPRGPACMRSGTEVEQNLQRLLIAYEAMLPTAIAHPDGARPF